MSKQEPSRAVSKVAVLRANALGDYIFSTPALNAIKRSWPEAELVYLGNAWHRDFLDGRPGAVDRVEIVPKCHGVPHESDRVVDAAEVDAFFARMREEQFDVAFQMHGGGGNSNPFVRRLGAKLAVGFQASGAPALDRNLPYTLYHNEVLRYLELVQLSGVEPGDPRPQIFVTGRDHHELNTAVPGLRRPFAVLHPGATDPRRRWPAEKFGVIADELAENGLHVYVTGVSEEAPLAEQLISSAASSPTNLCGRISVNALTALLFEAELLVSNDTGPLHLARAVGTPTVGIYWTGNVINAGPVTSAGNRVCMSWTTACPLCGMDCIANDAHVPHDGCAHETSFLDAISVEEVWINAEALLSASAALRQRAAV